MCRDRCKFRPPSAYLVTIVIFFFSSRRRHTRSKRDWSSDVCSSDLGKTISGDGNAQITNAIFEKNDCAVYIEELDRSLPSYEYGITYSKFIDNTCDRSEERRVGKECRS